MGSGQWFWIVYIIIGIFGGGYGFAANLDRRYLGFGGVIFILIGLLGWGVFGPPIR